METKAMLDSFVLVLWETELSGIPSENQADETASAELRYPTLG
jgi:hypothetical protein